MILNINKPVGPTSHDIVDQVRRETDERRVGHAGTLDPFAEGVLLILVGKEDTKRQSEFLHMDKTYETNLVLGASSDTDDKTGIIAPNPSSTRPSENKIRNALALFMGSIDQVPPAYSAVKIKGKKAYEIARRGETPVLAPKKVTVHSITLLSYAWPLLSLRIHCSSGTYIRAIARDLGNALGCGAYLDSLIRTRIGPYSLNDSLSTKDSIMRYHDKFK